MRSPRGHQSAFHGLKHDAFAEIGTKVKSCALRSGIGGQRMMGMVDNAYLHVECLAFKE